MDFEEIIKELKQSLLELVRSEYQDFKNEGEVAVKDFVDSSKVKLERWTKLLAAGEITLGDYKWLLESQKDLFAVHGLYVMGISKIRIGIFKNKLINTVLNVVTRLVL